MKFSPRILWEICKYVLISCFSFPLSMPVRIWIIFSDITSGSLFVLANVFTDRMVISMGICGYLYFLNLPLHSPITVYDITILKLDMVIYPIILWPYFIIFYISCNTCHIFVALIILWLSIWVLQWSSFALFPLQKYMNIFYIFYLLSFLL